MANQNNSEYQIGVKLNVSGLGKGVRTFTGYARRMANVYKNMIKKIDYSIGSTSSIGSSSDNSAASGQDMFSYLNSQIDYAKNSIQELTRLQEESVSKMSSDNTKELNEYLMDSTKAINAEKKELKELEKALKTYTETTDKAGKENKEFSESFNLISYASLGLFRKILKYGVRAFSGLAKAGSEYYEVNNNFNRIMKEGVKTAENYANKVAVAFGRNITDVKSDMTLIYTLLRNSNVEQKTATALSANLVGIASDMASLWGVDTTQAVNAVIAGLQGLPKAAKSLGVYLTDSQIKEYLVQAGYAEEEFSGGLSQDQRILGAYLKVMSDAGYAIGNFAENQKSVANQLKILQSTLKSIKENLGTTLNTILSPLLQLLNKVLKVINSLANQLQYLPKWLQMVVGALTLMIVALPILGAAFVIASYYGGKFKQHLAQITKEMAKSTGMTKVYGKALTFLSNNWKTITVIAIAAIIFISSLARVFKKSADAEKETGDETESLTDKYKKMQKTLGGFDDVNIASFAKNDDGLDLIDTTAFSIENLEKSINQMVERMTGISDITDKFGGLNNILLVLSGTILVFKGFKLIKSLGGISKIIEAIRVGLFGGAMALAKLKTMISALLGKLAAFAGVVASVWLLIEAIKGIVNAFNSSLPTFAKIADAFFLIGAAIGAVIMMIGALTHNWRMFAIGMAGAAVGFGGYGVTNLIATGGKSAVPQMATGGVVSKPVLATVGEGKYDEAVVPLGNSPQFTNMKSDIAEAVVAGLRGSNVGNNPINIEIKVDEDYIYRAYNRQSRLYGGR